MASVPCISMIHLPAQMPKSPNDWPAPAPCDVTDTSEWLCFNSKSECTRRSGWLELCCANFVGNGGDIQHARTKHDLSYYATEPSALCIAWVLEQNSTANIDHLLNVEKVDTAAGGTSN